MISEKKSKVGRVGQQRTLAYPRSDLPNFVILTCMLIVRMGCATYTKVALVLVGRCIRRAVVCLLLLLLVTAAAAAVQVCCQRSHGSFIVQGG